MGHSPAVLYNVYAHVIDQYEESPPIDIAEEVMAARTEVAGARLSSAEQTA